MCFLPLERQQLRSTLHPEEVPGAWSGTKKERDREPLSVSVGKKGVMD